MGWEPQGEAALGNCICSEPGGGRKPTVELAHAHREGKGRLISVISVVLTSQRERFLKIKISALYKTFISTKQSVRV